MGEVFFSPTLAWVFKRIEYTVHTSTVVERLEEDALPVVLSREGSAGEPQFEWRDITREFGQKVHM